jgi:aryl-alcohol dehydrogenase-like predicted oxidoreductase
MGMSHQHASFGGYNDEESLKVLTRAADLGIKIWDTSDIYGPFTNESLIGRRFKETGRRDEIFLATKFGNKIIDGKASVDGTPECAKQALAAGLERLQTDGIGLYYQYRVDTNIPIEKTVQAMAELKSEDDPISRTFRVLCTNTQSSTRNPSHCCSTNGILSLRARD